MSINDLLRVPTVEDLIDIVSDKWFLPKNGVDEVYPRLLLGDEVTAKNIPMLRELGITHILNAACGAGSMSMLYVQTGSAFYANRDFACDYLGIRAMDCLTYNLSQHFQSASDFIESALSNPNGKVFVHCRQGISRSATLVVAFLILKRGMSALESVTAVRNRREIFPNRGFLHQIAQLYAGQKFLKETDQDGANKPEDQVMDSEIKDNNNVMQPCAIEAGQ